jgi:hypothetical protein
VDDNFATVKQRENPRQFPLHSAQTLLNLPAVKVSAVVLEQQFEVHDPHAALPPDVR